MDETSSLAVVVASAASRPDIITGNGERREVGKDQINTTLHDPLSTHTNTHTHTLTPIPTPDGGLEAWTQVLAAHLIQFNTWGTANSFGIFQSYYATTALAPPSAVSWIGSLQIFLVFFVGSLSGRALDAGYCRGVLLCGAVLQVSAVFLASVSTAYWQLLVTQGLLDGLGNGCVFCPIIALVSTFFERRRSLAIGLVTSGASTGGIVLPLVAERLLYRVGFPWTMRVMGFIMLFNWVVALLLIRTRTPPRRSGPLVDLSAFKDLAYTWYCVGGFLNLWAAYFAYYYLGTFSRDIIKVDSSTAFILLLVLNGVGIIGRTIPSYLADRYFGAVNVYIPITIMGSILFYCWPVVHTISGMYVFAVTYGIIGAAVQGLFLACCASLTTDLQKMGTRTGMVFTIVSISALTGPPIAGKLIEVNKGSYLYAQMFGGSALMAGAIALSIARVTKTGWVWKRRV